MTSREELIEAVESCNPGYGPIDGWHSDRIVDAVLAVLKKDDPERVERATSALSDVFVDRITRDPIDGDSVREALDAAGPVVVCLT